jgi:hypothetical protein
MKYVNKIRPVRFKKYRSHPLCPDHCVAKLEGICENARRTGLVPEDFEMEIKTLDGLSFIPANTYVAECEHGREFLMVPTEATKQKYGDKSPT